MNPPKHTPRRSDDAQDQPPTIVRTSALLSNITDADLRVVMSKATVERLPARTYVYRQGEPARTLFLLESGRVSLRQTTANGDDVLVRFAGPGDIFGDKAAIFAATYGTFAQTVTAIRAYSWTHQQISELLLAIPTLHANLFSIVTSLLESSRRRYRLLATTPVESRIRIALSDLARKFGERSGDAVVIAGRSLQQDIADLASTTIFTVSRVLNDLARRGLLSKTREQIVLHGAL